MKITARSGGKYTILELDGRLILGPDTIELRNAVCEAARNNPQKIILNLAQVTYADSCGIGELVRNYLHVRNRGGSLVLTDLPERVRKLLTIAKLTPVFEIYDNEEEAIANCQENVLLHRMCG